MGIINRAARAIGFHKTPKASPIAKKQGGNRGRAIKHAPARPQIPQNQVRVSQHGKPLANRNAVIIHNQQSFLPRAPAVHIQQHFHSPAGQYNYSVHTQVPPNSTYNSGGLHVSHTTHSNYPLPQFSFNQAAVPLRPNAVYHLQPGQALYLQTTTTPQAPAYGHKGGWGVSPKGGLHPPYPQQPRPQFHYYPQPQFHPGEFQQHKNALLDGHTPMREAPPPYSPRQNSPKQKIPGAHARPHHKVAAAPLPLPRKIKPVRSTPHSIPVPPKSPVASKTPEPQASPVTPEKPVAAATEPQPSPKPADPPRHPDVSEKEVSIAKEKLGLPGDKETTNEELKAATDSRLADIEKDRSSLGAERLAAPTGLDASAVTDRTLREGGVHEVDIENLNFEAKYKLASRLLGAKADDIKLAQTVLENTLEQPDIVSSDAGETTGLTNDRPHVKKAMSQFALSSKEPILLENLQESYEEDLQELAEHQKLVEFGDDQDIEAFLIELELFSEEVVEEMSLKDMQASAQKLIDKKRQDIENYYQLLKPLAVE